MTVIMQVVTEEKAKTFRAEISPSGLHIEIWSKSEGRTLCFQTTLCEEAVQDLRTLCDITLQKMQDLRTLCGITLQKMQEARWRATEAKVTE